VTSSPDRSLVRALGRRDLTAFAVNRVIGGGIFGIPAVLYLAAGSLSVAAIVVAGVIVLGITLCFAEVGSAFRETGGPYLYACETFGPAVGFEVGWLMWVTQLGGFAAVTNLFVDYLGWFAPGLASGAGRVVIITLMVALLSVVNIRGVRRAATVNNLLTVAKLLPLAIFVLVGVFFINPAALAPATVPPAPALAGAVLLAIYAFSGFEVLGVPSGEVRDPDRTVPFALLAGLGIVAVVYVGVQAVAVGTLPDLGSSVRPLADAAERMLGPAGALLMVVGALLSTLGVAHAILLGAGRMPFAMAERGQVPAGIAAIHPVHRTPHIGLLISAAGMLGFTVVTNFAGAVSITVGLRVIIYIVTCAALPVLRRRPGRAPAAFRVPAGSLLAFACVVVGIGLLASRPWGDIIQLAVVLVLGGLIGWLALPRAARQHTL